jgi:hypothetical protein
MQKASLLSVKYWFSEYLRWCAVFDKHCDNARVDRMARELSLSRRGAHTSAQGHEGDTIA